MVIPFVDCQGLAGQLTLATLQTGKFSLQHRVSLPGGFGDEVLDANRGILANASGGENAWEQETGDPYSEWTPQAGVGYMAGLPPCSGFSLLNRSKGKNARGADSEINSCMKELVGYAGRCSGLDGGRGPEIIVFESVQGAYSQGRSLMQRLRTKLEADTGQDYNLTHVLMSGSTCGAAQMRHRYFFVAHRIPFGIDPPEPHKVVTYEDAIGDLSPATMTWDDQRYPREATTAFQRDHQRPDGLFDAGVTVDHGRMVPIIEEVSRRGWEPGETLPDALVRNDYVPDSIKKAYNDNWEADGHPHPWRGWGWPVRIRPERPGYVLTGGGIGQFVHWRENRLLTVRECARLMGLPDEWRFPTDSPSKASLWIGKACPVESGRWLANAIVHAFEGNPETPGDALPDGDREFKHLSTLLYKKWPGGNPPRKARSAGTINANG